ncbi:MAG: glycosyltransferase [Clostridia bacterium]|jgi:glycosyltransferase involved in cell wall biosynthesis|nr:glycosyltransferase [Clostridia bacterium]
MRQVCDILDERNILYDWYVLGTAFTKEVFDEIYSWFKENSHVHFLGYKDNIYPYLKQMDYLTLLTDREAWGLVISEALILGVPCITTNFSGVDKQIIDKENGIILEMTNDGENYKKRIDDIIQLKNKLKENVKKGKYDRERIIAEWIQILT